MGDIKGFMKYGRKLPNKRQPDDRISDWEEIYKPFPKEELQVQAARCMDCGIPFCNNGCPLGNLIPDWNDLVYSNHWADAIERLHATNNFPEFTGRLCPAPCESACVLGINEDPVSIKQIELDIIENAWKQGWIKPEIPAEKTGQKIAVVGSGPAGLAAAQQLTRAGHTVTCFERDDRIGGLLRYGIPEFKMEKKFLDRRLEQMEAEGTIFKTSVNVGADISMEEMREQFSALVLAGGATQARDLSIPGRDLKGIYQAMEFLPLANKVQEKDISEHPFSSKGKNVIIIGGGDTGADCLGTVHRQKCKSVHQFEIMPRPPDERATSTPWPTWPLMHRTSPAHEEGGTREYSINTVRFRGDEAGSVVALETVNVEQVITDSGMSFEPVPGTEAEYKAEMILLALGFTGPEESSLLLDLDLELSPRGTVARDKNWQTSQNGVFVCGDMGRGQSLIVWAIAEGRACAKSVDEWLMKESLLPEPLAPTRVPLT